MEIKETLMTRSFTVMDHDPYLLALKCMEEISRTAKVVERENRYESDGPHHRCVVDFDTIEIADDFSRIVFSFRMEGEDGILRVQIEGFLDLRIDETGFFSETFSEHYVKTLFPLLRKMSEEKIKFYGDKVDEIFTVHKEVA
jgi:hypothetical protein